MSERENKTPAGRVLRCDEWESMIADALDSSLPAADAAAFTRHTGECALCAQMFKETQQGRDWMQYLALDPEPPAGLVDKILARTTGAVVPAPNVPAPAGAVLPTAAPATRLGPPAWLAARQLARQAAHQVFEPRLMMTVAMAFFSIALTLNLTGIHLTEIRPADLQPSHLRATVTRQYYSTNEQVTKYYKNLRLVYEMEARVRELRRSNDTETAAPSPAPAAKPPAPQRDGTGAPRSTAPQGQLPRTDGGRTQGKAAATVPAVMVHALPLPSLAFPNRAGRSGACETGIAVSAALRRPFKKARRMRETEQFALASMSGAAKRSLV